MAVKMRLKRMGKKRNPIYRIVVADARSPRDGRNIGAQPTDTVARLLKNAGIEK